MKLQPKDYKFLLDALQVTATFLVAIVAYYLGIRAGKVTKSFSVNIDRMVELHSKIHDRMIEIVASMKANKYIDGKVQMRVRMCVSRLNLFDEEKVLVKKAELLLNGWETDLMLYKKGTIQGAELSVRRAEYIELTETVRDRADTLLRPFLKE